MRSMRSWTRSRIHCANVNNDVAAVNALGALINSVMAQAGNQITQDDADSLIADAQAIIELILSSG